MHIIILSCTHTKPQSYTHTKHQIILAFIHYIQSNKQSQIHVYIHTSITFAQTLMRIRKLTNIHRSTHNYIHYEHTYTRTYIHTYAHAYTHLKAYITSIHTRTHTQTY